MNYENYNKFINDLKSKYGDTYLASSTKEEQEEFIKYFAWAYHLSLDEAREKLKKFIEDSVRFYNCQFIISTHSPFLLNLNNEFNLFVRHC